MKVPRINVGVDVELFIDENVRGYGRVEYVDFIANCFWLHGDKDGPHPMQIYKPARTFNNFMRAVGEWDYHYRNSDDQRIYNEGKEYEQALIHLFRGLMPDDQHNCQKIVAIVTESVVPHFK